MNANHITLNPTFSTNPDFLGDWENFSQLNENLPTPMHIEQYVNGKQLACPMPLLKLKMALKNTQVGNSVYVTATDPNSTHDIGAFCRHLGYAFSAFMLVNGENVFHILVQKTV